MPADARLLATIRQLASHAAEYAQLAPDSSAAFAGSIERETEAAIACTGAESAPIQVRFSGADAVLDVVISCPAAPSAPLPQSSSHNGLSVDWVADGARRTCQIRQRTTV